MRRTSTRSALVLAAALTALGVPHAAAAPAGPAPVIQISSPPLISRYGEEVEVTGRVTPGGTAPGGTVAAPVGASWRVIDSALGGALSLDAQGNFSFRFPTAGLPDVLYVEVRVQDRAGHSAQSLLALLAPRSGPPDHSATATRPPPADPRPPTPAEAPPPPPSPARDVTGPALSLDSPADGERYGPSVTVRGRISDAPGPPWSVRDVQSLSWRLVGAAEGEQPVAFDPQGLFEFLVPTVGLAGTLILELRGTDGSANATSVALRLLQSEIAASDPATGAPPVLRVTSPADQSRYASTALVEGSVANSETDAGADRVRAVLWSLRGTGRSGEATPGPDGRFSLQVPTADLQGTLALELTAQSTSGARAGELRVLLDDGRGPDIEPTAASGLLYYRQTILLEGRVGDPVGSAASIAEVRSLGYEIEGRGGAPVPFDAEGAFRLSIPAVGLSGPQRLRLSAEDMNGHRTERTLQLADGNLRPSVQISEPTAGYRYGSRLRLRGRIVDPYAAVPGLSGIASVSCTVGSREVYAPSAARELPLGPDNTFDLLLPTRGLAGPLELRISVEGRSGNSAQAVVPLEQGEADIPSFSATWTDGQALAEWTELPGTERYTLLFRKENPGAAPGPDARVEGVRSPHRLTGLEPGNLYALRVLASSRAQPDGWSTTQRVLPVGGDTLLPVLRGEYGQIRVSWAAVPGSREYRVWRSTDPQGPPVDVSGSVGGNVFVDRQVAFGRRYHYRISPAAFPTSRGPAAWAETAPFPEKRAALRGELACEQARQVTLAGGYALVSAGTRGVRVIDVSAPEAPAEVAVLPARAARDVAVAGQLAYVADGPHGLRVFDLSDPRSPLEIGFRDTGDARRVRLRGGFAVVADGEHGLKVLDVTRATEPVRVASLDTLAALDVALQGDLAVVAAGPQGLRLVDLRDPRSPVELGACATRDARGVAVQGELAFVADGERGLAVVDITDPAHPVPVAGYSTPEALGVAVSGRFAYLADGRAGLIVLDVSDPGRPVQFAELPLEGIAGLAVRSRFVYAATADGLQTIHVVDEGTSFAVASCPVPEGAYALTVEGERGYVSGHRGGVQMIDLSQPGSLGEGSRRGRVPSDYALYVAVWERYAYIADGRRGIKIADVSAAWDDDTAPPPSASFFTGGSAWRIAVQGDRAYVADGTEGVKVLDLTDPLEPVEIAAVATVDARDVALSGSLLWLADGAGGLKVFDLGGAAPAQIAAVEGLDARRVRVSRSLACVATPEGVAVLRVEDPRQPARAGSHPSAHVEAIDLSGTTLYVAEGHRGLTVLDLSAPERPQVVSRCQGIYAIDVAVRGDWAFVPDAERLHAVQVLVPRWLQAAGDSAP